MQGRLVTDRLRGAVFNNLPKELTTESAYMEITLDITITKIEYNV